jgi:hypothetical protein
VLMKNVEVSPLARCRKMSVSEGGVKHCRNTAEKGRFRNTETVRNTNETAAKQSETFRLSLLPKHRNSASIDARFCFADRFGFQFQ